VPVWKPRGWQWIDPKKEIEALQIGISNGFITLQDVQSNYGRDVADVFEQLQVEKEIAKQYGIEMNFEPFGQKKPEPEVDKGGNTEEN
jgi:capsid protein